MVVLSSSFSPSVCACVSLSSITELPYPPKNISVERTGEPEQLLVRWKAQKYDDYEIQYSSQTQPKKIKEVWDLDTRTLDIAFSVYGYELDFFCKIWLHEEAI